MGGSWGASRGYRARLDDAYEGPEHIDWPRLRRDARAAPGDLVVEGHLVASDALADAASLAVLLRCPPEVCKARRLGRRPRSAEELEELEAPRGLRAYRAYRVYRV